MTPAWPQWTATGLITAATLLSGCTTVTTHKPSGEEIVMSQEEFAQYAEHVFRHHNQVMTELIESSLERGEQDPGEAKKLSAAESNMVNVCEPLNEMVSETLSGENVGLKVKIKLADAVPACEEASQVVEELIP
jgi:hypothetical protein